MRNMRRALDTINTLTGRAARLVVYEVTDGGTGVARRMTFCALALVAAVAACHRGAAEPRGAVLLPSANPSAAASASEAKAAWAPALPLRDLATSRMLTCVADSAGDVGCTVQGGDRWRPPAGAGPAQHLALSQLELCVLSADELRCFTVRTATAVRTLDGVAEAAVVNDGGCVREVGGGVRCWRRGGAPEPIAGVEGATAVAVGDTASCAIVADGTVRCWATGGTRAEPLAGVVHVDEVGCGEAFCCARGQGSVKCWGGDLWGQLGQPTKREATTQPIAVPGITGARSLAVGASHACVALGDGGVLCWGRGNELGSWGERCPASPGSCTSLETCQRVCRTPVRIGGVSDAARLVAGHGTCALRGGAAPLCWGGSVTSYGADESASEPVPFTW